MQYLIVSGSLVTRQGACVQLRTNLYKSLRSKEAPGLSRGAHRSDVVRRLPPERLLHKLLRALLRVIVVHEALERMRKKSASALLSRCSVSSLIPPVQQDFSCSSGATHLARELHGILGAKDVPEAITRLRVTQHTRIASGIL